MYICVYSYIVGIYIYNIYNIIYIYIYIFDIILPCPNSVWIG